MSLEYVHKDFLCKCNHTARLFKSPNDKNPVIDKILKPGDMFTSSCYVKTNTITLYQITYKINENDVLPLGYWCSENVINVTMIDDTEESKEYEVSNDRLLIGDGKVIIYSSPKSTEPISNNLNSGDIIITDRKIKFAVNNLNEIRYRINSVESNSDVDQSVIGMWIVSNYSITKDGINIIMDNSVPSVKIIAKATTTTSTSTSTVKKMTTNDSTDTSEIVTSGTDNSVNIDDINRINLNSQALYDLYGFNYTYGTNTSLMNVPLGRMLFVHGMPFQYNYLTDRRGNSTAIYGKSSDQQTKITSGNVDLYGRTFAKEIAANMPIAVIAPGEPSFMTAVKDSLLGYSGNSNTARNNWIPFWSDLTSDQEASQIEKLLTEDGTFDYYSMKIDTAEYYLYVNGLCQTSARFMGLTNTLYRGKYCHKIDWSSYNSAADQDYNTFEEVMGLSGGVSFAFDPASSITDTITNTTGESSFSSMLNSVSSKARELDFIGGMNGVDVPLVDTNSYQANVASTGWSQIGTAWNRITSFLQNTSKGMNVRFPEIWQDSNNSKSYDLDMHFVTPYATSFCKWRYVLVPYFHIFALAAPRSDTNTSVYQRPFLIRAFSKGYFNVEMGIVESLSWKRFGDGDMISADGVPTQIDVSVSFKDMYHTLAMSKTGSGLNSFEYVNVFFNNTGLMDMLGTLSGVNMNRITLSERLSLYFNTTTSAFGSLGSNFMLHFSDRTRQITQRYIVGV